MANDEAEFYIPGVREYKVGEEIPFKIAKTRYESGATLTNAMAVVKRVSDGVDVSSTFWSGGSGSIDSSYVRWSAFTMAAAGDYEINLWVDVSGNAEVRVQRIKVVA
jgi:hypothetical protein